MTRAEAWARLRREEALKRRWAREMRRISLAIESVRLDIEDSLESEDAELARLLADNARYRKVVDAFLNLRGYRKDLRNWREACGTDVGLWNKTKGLEWPRLWRILLRSRKERNGRV